MKEKPPIKKLNYDSYSMEPTNGKGEIFEWLYDNYRQIIDYSSAIGCNSYEMGDICMGPFGDISWSYENLLDFLREVAVKSSCNTRIKEAKQLIIRCLSYRRNFSTPKILSFEEYKRLGNWKERKKYLNSLWRSSFDFFDKSFPKFLIEKETNDKEASEAKTNFFKILDLIDKVSMYDNCGEVREHAGNLYRNLEYEASRRNLKLDYLLRDYRTGVTT